jgi:hypothetical protein
VRPTPRKRVHPFPSNGATPGLGAVTPSPKNVLRPGKTSERVRPRCGHASVGMRRSRAHAAASLLALVLGLGKKTVAWLARAMSDH